MEETTKKLTAADIAAMIDHSLLRPNLSHEDFVQGIELSKAYQVATACVIGNDVAEAAELLEGTGVGVCPVINFPHGNSPTEVKLREIEAVMAAGADEIDVVMPISRLYSGDYEYVEKEVQAIVEKAHELGASVKFIFENVYLDDEQIKNACEICENAGADYVKTSTGYGPGGATLEDVALMRASSAPEVKVKAAGGIRTLDDLLRYRAAGADRIGTSSTKAIMEEAVAREEAGTLREVSDWKQGD